MKGVTDSFLIFAGALVCFWVVLTAGARVYLTWNEKIIFEFQVGGMGAEEKRAFEEKKKYMYSVNYSTGTDNYWLLVKAVQSVHRESCVDFPTQEEISDAMDKNTPYSNVESIRPLRFKCSGQNYSVVNEPIYFIVFRWREDS